MHELDPGDYGQVRPLFAGLAQGRALVYALFEGHHVGRVFVDRPTDPSAALLTLACEFWYVGGDAANAEFLSAFRHEIVPALLPSGGALFLLPPDAAWQQALQKALADVEVMTIARSELTLDAARFAALGDWRARVPGGFRVQCYDCALAEGAGLAPLWGGLDRFLERGFGFAVLRGDEVVSRCHTVLVGDGRAEISIETSEPYRRQGLGSLAARALIEHSLARGIQPVWSCWSINTPSLQMAQKLGFVDPVDIPVLFAPQVLPR